jgi:hypothetical protein
MSLSDTLWENWSFAPVTRKSMTCAFIGSTYCLRYCPDGEKVPPRCTLGRCGQCTHRPSCPCTSGRLPKPITLHIGPITPYNPNGTTLCLARAQVDWSPTNPPSTWLLCDPRLKIAQTIDYFSQTYNVQPKYHLYVANLEILIAGPIPAPKPHKQRLIAEKCLS